MLNTESNIKVSASATKDITAFRSRLKEAWHEYLQAGKNLQSLKSNEEQLNDQVNQAETGSDPGNSKQIADLITIREQLRLTRIKLKTLEDRLQPQLNAVADALGEVGVYIGRAINPAIEQEIDRLTRELRPYYRESRNARTVAEMSDYIQSLRFNIRVSYERFPRDYAPKVIAWLDLILAGKFPFEFNSYIEADEPEASEPATATT